MFILQNFEYFLPENNCYKCIRFYTTIYIKLITALSVFCELLSTKVTYFVFTFLIGNSIYSMNLECQVCIHFNCWNWCSNLSRSVICSCNTIFRSLPAKNSWIL